MRPSIPRGRTPAPPALPSGSPPPAPGFRRSIALAAQRSALPWLAGLLIPCFAPSLVACKGDEPPPRPKVSEHRPEVRRPIDKTPLPPLAANRGGATGKPLWGTSFGGLGIDAPR